MIIIARPTAVYGGCGNRVAARISMELSGAVPRRRKRRAMRIDRALLLSMGFIALFFTMVRPAAGRKRCGGVLRSPVCHSGEARGYAPSTPSCICWDSKAAVGANP